jgi:hypothetical protein
MPTPESLVPSSKRENSNKDSSDMGKSNITIVFVDRGIHRDKATMKLADVIYGSILALMPTVVNGQVIVSDAASFSELRELGTIILKHISSYGRFTATTTATTTSPTTSTNAIELTMKSFESVRDSKVLKSLKNVLNEVVRRVASQDSDMTFFLYSSETDQFDIVRILRATSVSNALTRGGSSKGKTANKV